MPACKFKELFSTFASASEERIPNEVNKQAKKKFKNIYIKFADIKNLATFALPFVTGDYF